MNGASGVQPTAIINSIHSFLKEEPLNMEIVPPMCIISIVGKTRIK